ncbi:MAG TPA: vitamin K epoxide reductase family protein [Gemmatimonadaceae bacterium]|nr:vitamin K epoxide reductase family protein [Gemmatimonadaceae bacterium]
MTRRMGIAAIALVGVFVAMYLTLYKVGVIGELTCSIGSCETVNLSSWSIFLGLPVAAWGVGFYVAMLIVSMIGTQPAYADSRGISLALVAMSGWGVVFSGWLSYLEARVINAWCMWCVASACLVMLLFVLSMLDLRATRSTPA